MNPCAVSIDEANYQDRLCADEAADECQSEAADQLAVRWYHEFEATGRIDFLDWDQAEIEAEILYSPASDIFELLADEALREVRANPGKYEREPDYESIAESIRWR